MIQYNIKLFEINNKEERHKHFLVFMIRKFFWYKFNWTFNRIDFINIWIEKYWYNKNTIKWIFDKWIKDNNFILKDYIKRGKKYYVLKTNKEEYKHNITIKVEDEILNKITSVNIFYTFCFLVIASKPFKYKIEKEKETSKKFEKLWFLLIPWRTLNGIWRTFNNFKKDNVLYHINNWKELFKPYFNVITRHIPYYDFKIPISNLYFFDWIEYISDKKVKWGYEIHHNNFDTYLKDISSIQLIWKYWLNVKTTNWIRDIDFYFWEDLDLWRNFLDENWKIKFKELYKNYGEILEKAINQYILSC